MVILVVASGAVGAAMAQDVKAPRIVSWSNTGTADKKTAFQVKPNERITFSVKAEGVEKYQWLVNNVVQKQTTGASFKWTVPNKKGMWKISVRTTNRARQQWVKERALLWRKWIKVRERHGKRFPDEKAKFIRDVIDLNVYPVEARKEWTVSTFLKKVNPGDSIQDAINSLPAEGGIVELAPGVHNVRETIVVKKSNLTVHGTHEAVVKHHAANGSWDKCFYIPRGHSNITFEGFRTTSSYTFSYCRIFAANGISNFTVRGINDTSWAAYLANNYPDHPYPETEDYAENICYINNTIAHRAGLGAAFARRIYWVNNRISHAGIDANRNNMNGYILNNRIEPAGTNCGIRIHGGFVNSAVEGNVINALGRQRGIWIDDGGPNLIIRDNTVTGKASIAGIELHACRYRNVIITNNRIYGNHAPGIKTSTGKAPALSNATIVNNVIYNNTGDGIRMTSKYGQLDITNNIIVNNGGYGICYTKTGKPSTVRNNNVWGNRKGNYRHTAPGAGDISCNPLFADPAKGDFHLKSKTGRWNPKAKKWVKDKVQSPCIDAGDPKADFPKEPDPNGGRVNIGAYGNTTEASKGIKK